MKKDTQKYVLGLGVLLGCFFTVSISTRAQTATGVSDKEILIGSCSALEGPSHFLGAETVSGAKAYFAMVNDAGGVDGRKLKLVAYDDSYDPAKTEACFNRLMEQKVFALGFFVGTPTAVKYIPMAESNKIPLVGLFTGAQTLYVPMRHWIVNVRASYFDETREQIDGMWGTLGYKTVALYRRELTRYFPSAQPNFVSLEGFVDAMVLVEGLKRAGKELTRDGLIRGIESIHEFDMGLGPQLKLNYSSKSHKGFDHVLPTVVRGGRAVPFTDWSTATP